MMRKSQWAQRGANAWIAHSKLSNVCDCPAITTSNALSYSFPQVSQRDIKTSVRKFERIPLEAAVATREAVRHVFRKHRVQCGALGTRENAAIYPAMSQSLPG